jgi:hypothetical protein
VDQFSGTSQESHPQRGYDCDGRAFDLWIGVATMTGLSASVLAPILLMVILLTADAWVYTDAKARAERGRPVTFSYGSFVVETPIAWFLGCLILWVVFFPLYLNLTGRNPLRS